MAAPHILVADDDATICKLLATIVKRIYPSARITTVADGQAALTVVQQDDVALLITDYQMPGLDGLALTQRLREQGHTLPVVLISADHTVKVSVHTGKVNAFLVKPIPLPALRATLDQWLPASSA